MGARAAILAATKETSHLVLISYPLHTNQDLRDKILLDLSADKRVIFVSGDRDSICDLLRLQEVRGKMIANSWLCMVEGADHGMNMKPKSSTAAVVTKTGEIVAQWLMNCNDEATESHLSWNAEANEVKWSGWYSHHVEPKPAIKDSNQGVSGRPKRKRESQPDRRTSKRSKGLGRGK